GELNQGLLHIQHIKRLEKIPHCQNRSPPLFIAAQPYGKLIEDATKSNFRRGFLSALSPIFTLPCN
ncbi:CvgSY, partial [Pasteurella multocida subsp. multocida str. Anand1_cattle]